MSDPLKFKALLEELKSEYLNKMPERIEALTLALDQKDENRLEELFHNYKGTGKTHGFPELSLLAEKLEKLFLKNQIDRLSAAEWAIQILHELYLQEPVPQRSDMAMQKLENHPLFHRILALEPGPGLTS